MCENCIGHHYPDIKQRLISHGFEGELLKMMLDMSPHMAARYDTGDLDASDPRIQAANKHWGDFTSKERR